MTRSTTTTYRSYPFTQKLVSELISSYPDALERQQLLETGHAHFLVEDILNSLLPYSEDRTPVELSSHSHIDIKTLLGSLSGTYSSHFDLTTTVRERLREIAYFTLLCDEVQYGLNLEWYKANSKIFRFQLVAVSLKYFGMTRTDLNLPYYRKQSSTASDRQSWISRTLSFQLPSEYRSQWKQTLETLSKIDTLPIPPYVQQSIGRGYPMHQSYDVSEYKSTMETAVLSITASIGWIHSWGTPPESVNDFVYCDRRLRFLIFCARIRESIFHEINRCLEPHLLGWGFPLKFERLPTSWELSDAQQTLELSGTVNDPRIRSLLYLPARKVAP